MSGVQNPGSKKYTDREPTNIRLPAAVKKAAKDKAKGTGQTLARYVEKLIRKDLKLS